jgi:membrane-associated protease RseP (regulator of RpoE activity)
MRITSFVSTILLANAATIAAQGTVCTNGPGTPFGITGYTCASCGLRVIDGGPPTYFFSTEPRVTDVSAVSHFKIGDIITTIDGKPITTEDGARGFATPTPGKHVISLRRLEGVTLWATTFHIEVNERCGFERVFQAETHGVAALAASADRVGHVSPPPQMSPDPTSRVGFAVACTPSCSKITGKDGRVLWKHDGYPAVVSIRKGSPAAEAGLQIGDLIAEVNGVTVVDEDGSRILAAYSGSALTPGSCFKCEVPVLKMNVIRDGQRRELTIYLQERRP